MDHSNFEDESSDPTVVNFNRESPRICLNRYCICRIYQQELVLLNHPAFQVPLPSSRKRMITTCSTRTDLTQPFLLLRLTMSWLA